MMTRTLTRLCLPALLVAGLFAALPAGAQDRPAPDGRRGDPAQRIERRVQHLDEKLDLTDAQEAQIRSLLEATTRDPEARKARAEQLRARRAETDRAIEAVLDAAQRERYTALKAERQAPSARNREQGQRRRNGEARTERREDRRQGEAGQARFRGGAALEGLNLTEDQQTRIREVLGRQRETMRTWMQEHREATREEKRAYFTDQAKATDAAIEALLTPEQVEQYRRNRAERRARPEHRGRRG